MILKKKENEFIEKGKKRGNELLEKGKLIKKGEEKTKDSLKGGQLGRKSIPQLKNELKEIEKMEEYIKKYNIDCFELSDYVDSGSESVIYNVSLINKKKPEQKKKAIMKLILSRKRNDNELKIASKLKNNNIIKYCGHYTLKQNESTMLLIEPAKYSNLRSFQKNFIKKQILSESFLNFITCQILNGLSYLHKCSIVHMDLKPQNLVINEFLEVKIIDFSISINYKNYEKDNNTDTINVPFCGTNFYIPKEVIKRDSIKVKDLNKIDLYALGVIIYNLAFGKYPYGLKHGDEDNYDEILRKIENGKLEMENDMDYSKYFLDFLSKLLKKNINERMNIQEALNHYWIKGNKLLLEEKEKCGNASIFLTYLITDHIKNFNDYINA